MSHLMSLLSLPSPSCLLSLWQVFNIPKRTTINLHWGTLGPIRKFNHEIAKLEAPDATRRGTIRLDCLPHAKALHEKNYNNQLGAWSIDWLFYGVSWFWTIFLFWLQFLFSISQLVWCLNAFLLQVRLVHVASVVWWLQRGEVAAAMIVLWVSGGRMSARFGGCNSRADERRGWVYFEWCFIPLSNLNNALKLLSSSSSIVNSFFEGRRWRRWWLFRGYWEEGCRLGPEDVFPGQMKKRGWVWFWIVVLFLSSF